MAGCLTTTVTDGLRGAPAAGMLIDVFRLSDGVGERHHVRTVETDASGGTVNPLLDGEACVLATYELLYHTGRYFRAARLAPGDAPFVDLVPVRVVISDSSRDNHLSLQVTPWAYVVYRG